MNWAVPEYTKKEINKAGVSLRQYMNEPTSGDLEGLGHAVAILNNFRAAHAFPMNTIQNNLRRRANSLFKISTVAQRLKRRVSIVIKLDRFPTMQLWDMQDIGGCRAIVPKLDDIERLVESYKASRIRHRLLREKDYVQTPKDSGYRSRHLIYSYVSDSSEMFNGMKIEIQIRTLLQHAWATTVETVDLFTKQALKSSRGERDWERFFQLMGTVMALREGTAPVPDTPTDVTELKKELKECANKLKVLTRLNNFKFALKGTQDVMRRSDGYYLLSLNNERVTLRIRSYNRKDRLKAIEDYARVERGIRQRRDYDAVLVSVKSIGDLRRAYPNYFADTSIFIRELERALKK